MLCCIMQVEHFGWSITTPTRRPVSALAAAMMVVVPLRATIPMPALFLAPIFVLLFVLVLPVLFFPVLSHFTVPIVIVPAHAAHTALNSCNKNFFC
jgi:hypothetical protein